MMPLKTLIIFLVLLASGCNAFAASESFLGKLQKKNGIFNIQVKAPATNRGTFCLLFANQDRAPKPWMVQGLHVEVEANIVRETGKMPCLAAEKIKPALYDPAKNLIKQSAGLTPKP